MRERLDRESAAIAPGRVHLISLDADSVAAIGTSPPAAADFWA